MSARHATPLQALLFDEGFDGDVYPNEPMARHTTYRIGGPARFFVQVGSIGALTKLIEACQDSSVPWLVVGRGSNLLVADAGYDGVVIALCRDFRYCRFDSERSCFCVGAGFSLSSLVQEAYTRNLAGLEFAVGTPGSVGGALRMNAGSRDRWLGQQVQSVTVYEEGIGLRRLLKDDLAWGYRRSPFTPEQVLLECEIAVEPADPVYIRSKMDGSLARRRRTQPLGIPSCGSVFRNPEGASAGELIEQLGLKGLTRGGAQVSTVHSNFIVNTGNATAQDVFDLICAVRIKVSQAYGIELQPEVRFVGF